MKNIAKSVLRIVLIVLILLVPIFAVKTLTLTSSPFSNSGMIVVGTKQIDFYELDKSSRLQSIDWGAISVDELEFYYFCAFVEESGWVKFTTDAASYLFVSLFRERQERRWTRWGNNTLVFLNMGWTTLLLRLTAQWGSPAGVFNFNCTFETF